MRRDGLWHPRLSALVASLGHTDALVLADAGLSVPSGVETVDLVWKRGEPRLLPVLDCLLTELVVERAVIADRTTMAELIDRLHRAVGESSTAVVTHEELKAESASARAVVRTGEDTPYVNVILYAGVPF